jgi:hypothetical protein
MASSSLLPPFLDKFTIFARLPLETRLKIWRDSCGERVVEMDFNTTFNTCNTPAAFLVAPQVCCESCTEMLRYYKLSFAPKKVAEYQNDVTANVNTKMEGRIYFDFEVDILYLFPSIHLYPRVVLTKRFTRSSKS